LEVRVGTEAVKARRLPHVQPSEMVSFTLKPADLAGLGERAERQLEVAIT
jgi:hypothetical protein